MKNKKFLFVILFLTVIGFILYLLPKHLQASNLTVSSLSTPKFTPTSSPSPTMGIPKFNFNKSTNLKEELQTVDPKIDTNDFSPLQQIISSLK